MISSPETNPGSPVASRSIRLLLPALVIAAAAIRLSHLGALEPFVDEAGNVLTSLTDEVRRIIDPIGQGRPWLAYMFRLAEFWPGDPMLRARETTAVVGLVTLLALAYTAGRVYGPAAALAAAAFWGFCPYVVFFERLALQDPFVTGCCAVALACFVRAAAHRDRIGFLFSFLGGVALGSAVLVKVSAVVFFPAGGILYLCIQRRFGRPLFAARLLVVGAGAAAVLLSLGRELPRLGGNLSNFHALPAAESSGFAAALLGRCAGVFHEIHRQLAWHHGYDGGWFWIFLGIAASAAIITRFWTPLWLAGLWLAQMGIDALIYNLPYARYFHVDYLLPCLAVASIVQRVCDSGAVQASPRVRTTVLAAAGLLVISWVGRDVALIRDPFTATIPADEKSQYLTGPWSGSGLRPLYAYFDNFSRQHNTTCLVVTHAYWRVGCYGLMLASSGNPRVRVVPSNVARIEDLERLHTELASLPGARNLPVFFLFEVPEDPVPGWFNQQPGWASLALRLDRANGSSRFEIYQADPFVPVAVGQAREFALQRDRASDLWIGPHFGLTVEAAQPAREIVIEGDSDPRFLARKPILEIEVDGATAAKIPLAEAGNPFRIVVPALLTVGRHEVRLIGDQWFHPSDFGPSQDSRMLFIRLGKISVQ